MSILSRRQPVVMTGTFAAFQGRARSRCGRHRAAYGARPTTGADFKTCKIDLLPLNSLRLIRFTTKNEGYEQGVLVIRAVEFAMSGDTNRGRSPCIRIVIFCCRWQCPVFSFYVAFITMGVSPTGFRLDSPAHCP
jgi:hypothetical protein